MATNVYSAQIGLVNARGDVNIIYPKTLATNVSYTNADMTGVTTVGGALDWLNSNKVESTSELKVLASNKWNENAYDLSEDYPNSTCNISVSAYNGMSDDDLNKYNKAKLIGSNTNNTIYATGEVPSTSMTVMVTVFKKGGM